MDQPTQNLHETVALLTHQYTGYASSYEFRRMVRRLERNCESLVQSCRQQAESFFQAKLDSNNSELARAVNEANGDADESLQIIDRDECKVLIKVDDLIVVDLITVLTMPLDEENIYICCSHILTTYTALPLLTEHVDRLLDHMGMMLHERRNSRDMMEEGILHHIVLRQIISVLATTLTRAGASDEHDGHLLPLHSFEETITLAELLIEKAVVDISSARWKPSNSIVILLDSSRHGADAASDLIGTFKKRKADEIENDSEEEAKFLLLDVRSLINYLLRHASDMNDKREEFSSEECMELLRDLRDVAEKFSIDSIEYAVDAIESSEGVFQMENQPTLKQETLSELFYDVIRQAAVTVDLLEALSDLNILCNQDALATLCSTLTGFVAGIVSVHDSIDKEMCSFADHILLRIIRLAVDAKCADISSTSLVFLRILTSYGLTDENKCLLEYLFHQNDSNIESREESQSSSTSSFAKSNGSLNDTTMVSDNRNATNVVQASLLASMLFPSNTNRIIDGPNDNSSLLDSANTLLGSMSRSRLHNDPWHSMVARRLAPYMNEEETNSGCSNNSKNMDPHDRGAIWNYLERIHSSYEGRGI